MKNMNIIICDDRIDDRKNLSDLLSDYGEKKNYEFTITEYESGEQLCEEQSALEACQLLFLDINMQGMDGLKTAMRIKENTSQPYQEDLNLYLLQSTVHG
jgi:CheY-like chemotaxis protein